MPPPKEGNGLESVLVYLLKVFVVVEGGVVLAVSSVFSKRLGTPGKRGFRASDMDVLGSLFAVLLKRFAAVNAGAGFEPVLSSAFPKRLGTPGKRDFGPSAVGFPKREAPVFGVESVGCGRFLKRELEEFPVVPKIF